MRQPLALATLALALAAPAVRAEDCNANGIPDETELARPETFRAPTALPLTESPLGIAIADLDADGHDDILVGGSVLTGFLNRGVSEFVRTPTLGSVPAMRSMKAADWDGDGDADVFVTAGTQLRLLRNVDVTFPRAELVAIATVHDLAFADLNENGREDLIMAQPVDVAVALSARVGVPVELVRFPVGLGPRKLATGDLDGDGHADVVTLNTAPSGTPATLTFLFGDGAGALSVGRNISLGAAASSLGVGDVDGDGVAEAVAGTTAGLVVVDVDAERALALGEPSGPGGVGGIQLGDVDADGRAEVIGLRAARLIVLSLSDSGFDEVVARDAPSINLFALGHLGWTDDDSVDLVAAGSTGSAGVLYSRDRRDLERQASVPGVVISGRTVVADLDRDGRQDVALATTPDDELVIAHGPAESPALTELGVTNRSGATTFGTDVDGDGDTDLLCRIGAVQVLWLVWNHGHRRYELEDTGIRDFTTTLATADIDGDGDPDILTASAGEIITYENDGFGRFREASQFLVEGTMDHIVTGDIDGDGLGDAVVADVSDVMILRSRGDLSLELVEKRQGGRGPDSIALADVDRDGDLDLALGLWGLALNSGDGLFGVIEGLPGDVSRDLHVLPADLDRDGDIDLLGLEATLLNNGDGTFVAGRRIFTPAQVPAAAGDLDGDGRPDLLFGTWIARNGTAGTGDCDGNGRLDECDIADGAPDCDGDGVLDACEPDCDASGRSDVCELLAGERADCNGDGVLDVCEPDCDANGVPDGCDVAAGSAGDCDANGAIDACELAQDASLDTNRNGVLDRCEGRPFHRGDPNLTGDTDIGDAIVLLIYLFASGPPSECLESGDADDDGTISVTDAIAILRFLFQGGGPPAPPGPAPRPCGWSPGAFPESTLGCLRYISCHR